MALLAFDVCDEAEPARVVLVRRVVETLPRRTRMALTVGTVSHVDLTGVLDAFALTARQPLRQRAFRAAKPFYIRRIAAMRQASADASYRDNPQHSRRTVDFPVGTHLRKSAC
jgi:hypothetical protein